MSWEPKFRHFALIGICAAGFLSIPLQVYERIVQNPPEIPSAQESPYLTAPGNRTGCGSNGWIATQSDSSRAAWRVKCTGGNGYDFR